MKKNNWVIFLCLSLAFFLSGCVKTEIKNVDSRGKNIVCFGDSVTFGYGVERGEDYPSRLSKMVSTPVINAGVDGDTSSAAMARLDSGVLNQDPLLVIIEFGGNDFLTNIPREVTEKNIRQMIDSIQARGAMVALVDISAGMLFAEYHSLLSRVAREKNAILIPKALAGIITNPSLKSDFVHPNAKGYLILAQRILAVILPYLNQNSIKKGV